MGFFSKHNRKLACDPTISLLAVYSKEVKTDVQTKAYTRLFAASVSTIAKARHDPNMHQLLKGLAKYESSAQWNFPGQKGMNQ